MGGGRVPFSGEKKEPKIAFLTTNTPTHGAVNEAGFIGLAFDGAECELMGSVRWLYPVRRSRACNWILAWVAE